MILNFMLILLFPFFILIALINLLSIYYSWDLDEKFIFFIALTVSAVLSLFKTYGEIVLEIVGITKIYRRARLDDAYNVNITKFEMYFIYFLFLSFSFTFHFYNNQFVFPEFVSASFIIYLAADRLLNNKHLCKIKK